MTDHRRPPGPSLATGHVRVDAARAIAKLRAYRLADPAHWILEAIRAAVGSGATSITLDGDADDLWLRWRGPPWPVDGLRALLDDLVSPEPIGGYPRRLLAHAINSALALQTAWLDVIVIDEGGACRVRFSPDHLVPDADGVAPLATLAAVAVTPPDAGEASMVVHLRRRFGWAVVGRYLRGGELPELAVARDACGGLGVPLAIGGARVDGALAGDSVVRVGLGPGLDGCLAVAPAPAVGTPVGNAVVDFAELGVRMARHRWAPSQVVPGGLRLLLDLPRLPTNAARSEVRRRDARLTLALEQAHAAFEPLIDALIARLREVGDAAVGEPVRAAALATLSTVIGGAAWAQAARALTGPLARLAAEPLVRDLTGRLQPVASSWGQAHFAVAERPAPELARWLPMVPWIPPGDPAGHLLGGEVARPDSAALTLAQARARSAAYADFLARPRRQPTLAPDEAALVTSPIAWPGDEGGGRPALRGELQVSATPGPGTLTFLFEGRELGRLALPPPLQITAIVESEGFVPTHDFRRVVRDAEYTRVVQWVERRALDAVVEACSDASGGMAATVVRNALAAGSRQPGALARGHPLTLAPVWPLVDGTMVSLAALREHATLSVIAPGQAGEAPTSRPCVVASWEDRYVLARLLGEIPLVPYDHHPRPSPDLGLRFATELARAAGTVALAVRRPGASGAISFAARSSVVLHHRGVRLGEVMRAPVCVSCAIMIDSEAIVPTPDWFHVLDAGDAALGLDGWEVALLRATMAEFVGEPAAELTVNGRLDDEHPAVRRAWDALDAGDAEALLGAELAGRVRARRFHARAAPATPTSEAVAVPAHPVAVVAEPDALMERVASPLIDVLRDRIARSGLADGRTVALVPGRGAPLIVVSDHSLELAGDAPLLVEVGRAVASDPAAADSLVLALVAHLVTVTHLGGDDAGRAPLANALVEVLRA